MECASRPRVGSRSAVRRRPKNGIKRTSSRERVKQRNRKLALLPLRARRKSTRPNSPSMCKRGSGPSRNRKPSACFDKHNEKSASENKKSTDNESSRSEKSANGSRNTNGSAVCVPEKNVSKSDCGAERGMKRSSASENDAWHASSSGWRGSLRRLPPHHRLCPRYSLTLSLSVRFPSRLSYEPTPENGQPPSVGDRGVPEILFFPFAPPEAAQEKREMGHSPIPQARGTSPSNPF